MKTLAALVLQVSGTYLYGIRRKFLLNRLPGGRRALREFRCYCLSRSRSICWAQKSPPIM